MRLKNTSENALPIIIYSATNPTDLPGPGPQFKVESGEVLEKPISDFLNGIYPNINLFNPSGLTGSWEIQIDG